MKKTLYKILSLLLVFSVLTCGNPYFISYADNQKYYVNAYGKEISEEDIIYALNNQINVKIYSNNTIEQDNFSLNSLNNNLYTKHSYASTYALSSYEPVYAVYTVVVLGIAYTVSILEDGNIIIKYGQKVIDKTSSVGKAILSAAKNFIDTTLKKLKETKDNIYKSEESKKRVNSVLGNKQKERKTNGSTDIYNDPNKGGLPAANSDFDKLNEGSTIKYPNGTKVGQLPDGSKINVRENSSDGRPTLEIQRKTGRNIKIRY